MLVSPLSRVVNNWLHDVGTGLWAACLLVIVVLERRAAALVAGGDPAGAVAAHALTETDILVFWLMVAALCAITLTGALRLIYWRTETPAHELAAKRPALIGKHVAFLVIYGPGTVFAWWLLGSGAV